MKRYLLDTDICIFLLRGMYDINRKIDSVGLQNCYISEIPEAELKYGAELGKKRGISSRLQKLQELLSILQILPISGAIDMFASEKARLRLSGTPADDNFDLLIGCTAITYGMVMVTENVKDFQNFTGIQIENWIQR